MNLKDLTKNQKKLRERILDISYEASSSHIGSCVSSVDIIDSIYGIKTKDDRFILSNGHAGVALYVVLEKNGIIKNANLKDFNVHPDRNLDFGIDVSTGSLGQGLPIGVGMAMAKLRQRVYVVLSDGECTQGSIWESLRIAYEFNLNNLFIFINANGWGAYDKVSISNLKNRLRGFCPNLKEINGHNQEEIKNVLKNNDTNFPTVVLAKTTSDQFPFLKDLDAHYYVMNKSDYKLAKELLK